MTTPLSSNENKRGDTFAAQLKQPVSFRDRIILPEGMMVHGLVERVNKYIKLGDRAGLAF